MANAYDELIERNDIDELLREIDRLCERREWNELLGLRNACRLAVQRGKQLWGVAGHAEYRLALQAGPVHAAEVIDSLSTPFLLGPLPEVAASTHSWDELRTHVDNGPVAAVTAFERVVRGDDLSQDEELHQHQAMFEMPLVLQAWEPDYPLAEYKSHEALFPYPKLEIIEEIATPNREYATTIVDDQPTHDALMQLVATWTSESNATATIAVVEGDAFDVLHSLGASTPTIQRITTKCALSLMAWAGASGGAHGRRSGMAAGRRKAWSALAAICGLDDDWPAMPGVLGSAAEDIAWWTWGPKDISAGWHLRLGATDPVDGISVAIEANDRVD